MRSKLRMADLQKQLPSVFMSLKATAAGEESCKQDSSPAAPRKYRNHNRAERYRREGGEMAVSGIGTAYNILYDYQSRTQGTEQESKQNERFSDSLTTDGKTVPYGAMAKDGIIKYKGVIFTCDYENNRICLGDVSDKNKCINIALSGGGSLVVNRENLGDLSRAIGMFSPEDVNLILRALARDKQIQKMQHEIDDMENGEEAQQVIREKMQEIYKKVTKGETEEKFQIGGQSYSKKEWEKLLEEFDDAQDEVKEEQEERLKKLLEEKEKRKLLEKQQADGDEEEDELDKRIEKLFEDRVVE